MAAESSRNSDAAHGPLCGSLLVVSHKRHESAAAGTFAVSGGFPILKAQFARHAARVRLCVPVFPGTGSGPIAGYPANLTVVALPPYESRRHFLKRLPSIAARLWREIGRADLVYAMCPTDIGLLALLMARIRRRAVFISIDTDRAELARMRGDGRAFARLRAWLVGRCVNGLLIGLGGNRPAFFTGSEFLGSHRHWRQWVKTTVTSSDLPAFSPGSMQRLQQLRVIFVGRLTAEKNVGCLIEAVRQLVAVGRDLSLTIVGSGTERARLGELSRPLGEMRVRFLDQVPNAQLRVTRFLGADVLVLPSLEERQGKVLLEAMACSVPVVAARAGGIPGVVHDGTNGLLFDPASPAELAARLAAIMDDAALRRRLVESGYDYAKRNTLDASVAAIMQEVTTFFGITARNT